MQVSNIRLLFSLALRALFTRRSPYLSSILGLVAILGIALGVSVQIAGFSILDGIEKTFTESILGFNGHLNIAPIGEAIDATRMTEIFNRYKDSAEIAAFTPYLDRPALMIRNGKTKGIHLRGIDPNTFSSVYKIQLTLFKAQTLDQALSLAPNEAQAMVIGKRLADFFDIHSTISQHAAPTISVFFPKQDSKGLQESELKKFKVVGTFETGLFDFDSRIAFLDLEILQKFSESENRIGGFDLRLDQPRCKRTISEWIDERFGPILSLFPFYHTPFESVDLDKTEKWTVNTTGLFCAKDLGRKMVAELGDVSYQAQSWDELNGSVFKNLFIERVFFFLVLALLLTVAAANLFGVLFILMIRQKKEVSILYCLGMNPKKLRSIFVIEGMFLAGLGILFGSILGAALLFYLSKSPFLTAPEWYQLSSIPVLLSFSAFLKAIIFTMLMAYIAVWIVARKVLAKYSVI